MSTNYQAPSPYGQPEKKRKPWGKVAAGAGVAVLGIALLSQCGGDDGAEPTPTATVTVTPEPPVETPQAPSTPENTPHGDPAPTNSWGLSQEAADDVFLETVRQTDPELGQLSDAALLAFGADVCPAVEAGNDYMDIAWPELGAYQEGVVIGAAVGTYCPELLEAAFGTTSTEL